MLHPYPAPSSCHIWHHLDHNTLIDQIKLLCGLGGPLLSQFKSFMLGRSQNFTAGIQSSSSITVQVQGAIVLHSVTIVIYHIHEPTGKYHTTQFLLAIIAMQMHTNLPVFQNKTMVTNINRCLNDIQEWMYYNWLELRQDRRSCN